LVLIAGNLVKCGLHQYGVWAVDDWIDGDRDDDGCDAINDGLVVDIMIELLNLE